MSAACGTGDGTVPGSMSGASVAILWLGSNTASLGIGEGTEIAGKAAVSAEDNAGVSLPLAGGAGSTSSDAGSAAWETGNGTAPGSMSGSGVAILWLGSNTANWGAGRDAEIVGRLTVSAFDNAGVRDPRADGTGNASSGAVSAACGTGDGTVPGSMSGAGVAILWLGSNTASLGVGEGTEIAGKAAVSAEDNAGVSLPLADGAGSTSSDAGSAACGTGAGTVPESMNEAVRDGVSGCNVARAGAASEDVSAGEDTNGTARLCRPTRPRPLAAREAPARPQRPQTKNFGRKWPSER